MKKCGIKINNSSCQSDIGITQCASNKNCHLLFWLTLVFGRFNVMQDRHAFVVSGSAHQNHIKLIRLQLLLFIFYTLHIDMFKLDALNFTDVDNTKQKTLLYSQTAFKENLPLQLDWHENSMEFI